MYFMTKSVFSSFVIKCTHATQGPAERIKTLGEDKL